MTWIPSVSLGSNAEELSPGVIVERRRLFWLPVAAAGLLLGRGTARGESTPGQPGEDGKGLTWEEFIAECVPAANELYESEDLNEDAYLYQVASFAARLTEIPNDQLGVFGNLEPKVEFGLSHRGTPFIVLQWRMEPGAILPALCHPNTAVCTLAVEGEARIRNFEIEGEAPAYNSGSRASFLLRETHNEILIPGRVNRLSTTQDNIHYFQASSQGARGIDITTGFGGDGTFSFIDFEPDKPKDAGKRLFEAVWIGSKL